MSRLCTVNQSQIFIPMKKKALQEEIRKNLTPDTNLRISNCRNEAPIETKRNAKAQSQDEGNDYKEPSPAPLFEPGELTSWSFYRVGIAEFVTCCSTVRAWLGLACFLPPPRRRTANQKTPFDDDGNSNNNNNNNKINLEHNKAWLLAEFGGCGAKLANADPQSVHSSFRFSFCSQVELESMNMSSSATATVLMVNLGDGLSESKAKEMKYRRFESLERSISLVAHTLIRFSYGEILVATRNFSKGKVLGRGALSCVFRGRVGILRSAVAIKRVDLEDYACRPDKISATESV